MAGPVERTTSLLPQFAKEEQFEYSNAVGGLKQMLWGFLMKLVIADNCAEIVNNNWNYKSQMDSVILNLS